MFLRTVKTSQLFHVGFKNKTSAIPQQLDKVLSFPFAGPSHMSLYLLPHKGASLSTWSFGDGTPQFDLSGEYFIFYSHGLDAPTWTFWFEIQVLSAV